MTHDEFEQLIDEAGERAAQQVGWLDLRFVNEALAQLSQLIEEHEHALRTNQAPVEH